MGRKRVNGERSDQNYSGETKSFLLEEPPSKRQKGADGLPTDKIDVWLIKKPKSVPIEVLNNIRLVKKFKENNREQVLHTTSGVLECTLEKPGKNMFYFKAPEVINNIKEQSKLPILDSVRGIAIIHSLPDLADPFPDMIEETLEMVERNTEPVIQRLPFEIRSVSRKPRFRECKQERE